MKLIFDICSCKYVFKRTQIILEPAEAVNKHAAGLALMLCEKGSLEKRIGHIDDDVPPGSIINIELGVVLPWQRFYLIE